MFDESRTTLQLDARIRVPRRADDLAIRDSEERFRAAFMTGLDACCMVRLSDGVFVECNAEFENLFGYPRDEVIGRTSLELNLYADSADRSRAFDGLSTDGHVRDVEMRGRTRSGEPVICSLSESVVPISGVPHVVSVIRNVTAQRRAEEERATLQAELQQAQKMESVGRLAGGVAHDFNNMLSAILGYADMALDRVERGTQLYADLVEIQKAAKRSSDLTRQLLAFARKQAVDPKVLDLNESVEGMLKMLRRLIGEHIRLDFTPRPALPPVKMDPGQIDQILVNLCVNARDAIDGAGHIHIETCQRAVDEATADGRPGLSVGDYVCLRVTDSGCGMAPETMAHIFEPFYTTKGPGAGTGLGLATVYGIVRQNHGHIDVASEVGAGTTFTLYVPVHSGEVTGAQEADRCSLAKGGDESVLLVEDEPAILSMTARILEALGYHVLAAASPSEAFRAARDHGRAIDLLLADVVLPDMNGRELGRRLGLAYPGMKSLYTSGYSSDVIGPHGVLDAGVHFIQKPCDRNALAAKVREVLDGT